MQSKVISGALLATVLLVGGCDSGGTDSAGPATSAAASAGPGGRGGPGGGGFNMQTFTAVNLNTNGDSPGGANTAEVVTAAKAFLATLDATTRDKVRYDFSENQARQTWSNFPTTTVAREGVVLSDLTAAQQQAVMAMLKVALSDSGYQQVLNIQKSDDYLNSLGGQGADGFGALKDYLDLTLTPPDGQTGEFTLDYDAILHQIVSHRVFVAVRQPGAAGYTSLGVLDWTGHRITVPATGATTGDGFLSSLRLGLEHPGTGR